MFIVVTAPTAKGTWASGTAAPVHSIPLYLDLPERHYDRNDLSWLQPAS
jgi:hypothetical protein